MPELSKTYSPKEVEEKLYKFWEKNGFFKPKINSKKKPFVIAIPPPNITGSLHMGHALNNTIQDILIRRSRMKGVPTLWIPGTDHAGIATQNVVEKKLKKEDKTRHDLGREKFVQRVWQWKEEYGDKIIDQLKKLGCSCDWSRERFTMDKDYARAVEAAFIHYYKKGYIYRGERVVSWCPRCQTSLSDLEVERKEQKASLYYFRYDKNFPITIATTRPETKFGDTAVAVNPADARYKEYIGKTFNVHFAGLARKIKIIADKMIDLKFGTGALGVTPAHSLIDEELARKYKLPTIKVINQFGRMVAETGKDYQGLNAKEAREKLVINLKKAGLLEKEEEIDNNMSVCYRCGRELEPLPSQQWFLKMDKLVKPAIEAVRKEKIRFYPARWKKVYLDWMQNIRDWCISRQIWWGHRLPVWFCQNQTVISNSQFLLRQAQDPEHNRGIISKQIQNPKIKNSSEEDKNYIVSAQKPKYCPFCKKCTMRQSEDVLDTWFSSALWPFAVLGWPENKSKVKSLKSKVSDLDYFYPTSVLSTARDIIYLWVARMIFSGLEFTGQIPFSQVYIHPTVFNKEGRRMSKSLGTGVDPLGLMEKYGTDATRFGLAYQDTGVQDMKFSEEAILAGKKFANKIWNASRFALLAQNGTLTSTNFETNLHGRTQADKNILKRLKSTIKQVDGDLDKFKFGQAAHNLYNFFWHDFCDIYIEKSKEQLNNPGLKQNTQKLLLFILAQSLKLLHPFMPFLAEEIYQKLPIKNKEDSIMITQWPQ